MRERKGRSVMRISQKYKLKGNVDQIIAASEITEGMKNAGQIADAHKPYGEKNEKTDFI